MGEQQELTAETPLGKFKAVGRDTIITLTFALVGVLAYAMWDHKAEAREGTKLIADAIDKMTKAQREQITVQREWMCLSTMAPERREKEYFSRDGFCKQIARER